MWESWLVASCQLRRERTAEKSSRFACVPTGNLQLSQLATLHERLIRMIEPVLQGAELQQEISQTVPGAGSLVIWWLGQSGFVIKSRQGLLVIDPYLSEHLTRKYAGTPRPHVRMTRAPLRGADLCSVRPGTGESQALRSPRSWDAAGADDCLATGGNGLAGGDSGTRAGPGPAG